MAQKTKAKEEKVVTKTLFPDPEKMRTHPVDIFEPWCKKCYLCVEFCPNEVFEIIETGAVIVKHPENCNQCTICALHCPDYAILLEPKKKKEKSHK